MLGASAYFAVKIYEHINTLKDEPKNMNEEREPNRTQKAFSTFSPDVLMQRADEAYENEEYEKAISLLEEINEKKADDDEVLFKLGFMFQKLGKRDEALRYYKEALELDRDNEYIYNAMASLYREHGEFTSAQIQLKASLERNSNNAKTYYNYGNLLVDMKNYEEAKEMYKKAIELDSEFKEAKEELQKLED
jgi:tetratricopeptide (TPR) repeat protein